MNKLNLQTYYEYSDVFIIPNKSTISTRKEVDISTTLGNLTIEVPIISANMDTITEADMAKVLHEAGGLGALHRFMSVEQNVVQYLEVKNAGRECLVSVGVNRDSVERAKALYDVGARYFVIDIAHGHSELMRDMISHLKESYKDIFVVGGNVATPEAVRDLEFWGVDAIKVNIGNGSVCITKDVTGVTIPAFSCVQQCAQVAMVPIIADGGIRSSGDVAKAIGAGADFVMTGRMFAGTIETPGLRSATDGALLYRGMASKQAMQKIRTREGMPTAEGISISVEETGSAISVVENIRDGLRSSFSYVGARNMTEFQSKIRFGVRLK